MNRVKIDVPTSLPYATNIQLRITDINYGNHTGNQVFLELMHEARVRFLKSVGYTELSFGGAALIMGDVAIEFKSEILYGDEVEVQLGIAGHSAVAFDIVYLINTSRHLKKRLAAKAKTGMVCYDYGAKKVVRIPADALQKLSDFEVQSASQ